MNMDEPEEQVQGIAVWLVPLVAGLPAVVSAE